MSKLECFFTVLLGFFIYEVVFIRIGFFIGQPIGKYSIVLALLSYTSILFTLAAWNPIASKSSKNFYYGVTFFIVSIFLTATLLPPLSKIYDTSWDGQGYHQTAVLALSEQWNPVKEPFIKLQQNLPSQIFAEGYPSALWEIEASIYSLTGRINSAKILNFLILLVSGTVIYSLLRKIAIHKVLAFLISISAIIQPVFTIQMFTFMADGFGYQLILIGMASLAVFAVSPKSYWSVITFLFSILLLASTKYSHLPVVLILSLIFSLILGNRLLNKDYNTKKSMKLLFVLFVFVSIIFGYLPYVRNATAHKAMFYPTNIPDLMGSVKYNNVPQNLKDKGKPLLLFYGIFSKAQSFKSGDPTNKENVAILKIPFTFSYGEVKNAATLYNNRVGAGGPLFSGIVVSSLAFLLFVSFKVDTKAKRYAIYSAYFCLGTIIFLSLLAPTPNLLRYVNQLQLIPFIVIIVISTFAKNVVFKTGVFLLISLTLINSSVYAFAVIKKVRTENIEIDRQFIEMRESGKTYAVSARHLYSNYLMLQEQNIPFVIVDNLSCKDMIPFPGSSRSTFYCAL